MRLIDADALKKYLDDCAFCKNCPNKNKGNSYCTLDCKFPDYCDDEWKRAIDEQPTIEERKTGRWIEVLYVGNDNYDWECSKCGFKDTHSKDVEVPFCWHCGATMKGGAE